MRNSGEQRVAFTLSNQTASRGDRNNLKSQTPHTCINQLMRTSFGTQLRVVEGQECPSGAVCCLHRTPPKRVACVTPVLNFQISSMMRLFWCTKHEQRQGQGGLACEPPPPQCTYCHFHVKLKGRCGHRSCFTTIEQVWFLRPWCNGLLWPAIICAPACCEAHEPSLKASCPLVVSLC